MLAGVRRKYARKKEQKSPVQAECAAPFFTHVKPVSEQFGVRNWKGKRSGPCSVRQRLASSDDLADPVPDLPPARMRDPALHRLGLALADEANLAGRPVLPGKHPLFFSMTPGVARSSGKMSVLVISPAAHRRRACPPASRAIACSRPRPPR
jgi:hypothetical protein